MGTIGEPRRIVEIPVPEPRRETPPPTEQPDEQPAEAPREPVPVP